MTRATPTPSTQSFPAGPDAPVPAPATPRHGGWRWIAARLIRVVLGVILLYAGIGKARDAQDVKDVLRFDGFSVATRNVMTGVLLCTEITVGLMLILGWGRGVPLWITLAMLVAYSAQLAYLLAKHWEGDCGCWHHVMNAQSPRTLQVTGLIRNAIMAAGTVFVIQVVRQGRRARNAPTPA